MNEINAAISSIQQTKTLDLSGKNLSDEELAVLLPRIAKEHPNLNVLKFANNNLTKLPDSIKEFPFLQVLDVSNNNLKNLPDTIENLSFLKELDVSYNAIERLPESMQNLSLLNEIKLECNFDETLTECMSEIGSQNPDLLGIPDLLDQNRQKKGTYRLDELLAKMKEKNILTEVSISKNEKDGLIIVDSTPNGIESLSSPLLPKGKTDKSSPSKKRLGLGGKKDSSNETLIRKSTSPLL